MAAAFATYTQGGDEECVCEVTIFSDDKTKAQVDAMYSMLKEKKAADNVGTSSWMQQFEEAWYVGGSKEDQADSSWSDCIIHFICVPWKLIFALIPPTDYHNGMVSFFCSLLMIGVVTA